MPGASGTLFRRILLLQRDVPSAAAFYERALGLRVAVCTETYAEIPLVDSSNPALDAPALALQRADHEAQLTSGYTPIVHFEVRDIQTRVNEALRLGGRLDGAIRYDARGATCALRAPDGHMIGLFEPSE